MPRTRRLLLPLGLAVASVVVVSGCSVLESLVPTGASEVAIDDGVVADTTEAEDTPADTAPAAATGFVLPTCDSLYSASQNATLLDQVRVNQGDTSDGDYGYGTVNRELVGLLKTVRNDLRLSCTWYLPASESVSVTSVAIIDPEVEASVIRSLTDAGTAQQSSVGGGTLWTIDSTTSDESSDYIATEAHFLAPVACPSSLAETTCIAWITTNYSFGQAETLTVDAARNLAVYGN